MEVFDLILKGQKYEMQQELENDLKELRTNEVLQTEIGNMRREHEAKSQNGILGIDRVAPAALQVFESPPMNMAAAWQLARTKDFGFEFRPWGNDITVFEVVAAFERRIHRERDGFAFTMDVFRETAAAKHFHGGMRLVSGFSSAELEVNKKVFASTGDSSRPFIDYLEIPACVLKEIHNKVPSFFLGLSALFGPKVIRYLFFLELPSPVLEADLCASHLKEIVVLCEKWSVPCQELGAYVDSEASVKQFREEHSAALGCESGDIKQVVNMIGYGNSGRAWREQHNVPFTRPLDAIKATCKSLCRALDSATDTLPPLVKDFLAMRGRPSLSLMSFAVQLGERIKVDLMAAVLKGHSHVHGFINDSTVFHGPSVAEALLINDEILKPAGIASSVHVFPQTVDEYKAFVCNRAGVDFTFMPARMDVCIAKTEEIEYTNYMYPSPLWPKLVRPANPVLAAARAVAPFMLYCQDRETKKVQYFDEVKGIWMQGGGEFFLQGDPLSKVLHERKMFEQFASHLDEQGGKLRVVPRKSESHPLLKDPVFLNSVRSMLQTIEKHYATPLGKQPYLKYHLAFSNGVSVRFDLPFDQQVYPSKPEDRNYMMSPMHFKEVQCEKSRKQITEFGLRFVDFYKEQCKHIDDPEFTMESLMDCQFDGGLTLAESLLTLMPHAPCLQHCYYETAGGQLDAGDQITGLSMGFYGLFFDAGTVSGMMAGIEQLLIEWGPLGNNGKGMKRTLRETILGHVTRGVSGSGYSAVTNASILKDGHDKDGPKEELAKLANGREAVIDEVNDCETALNTKTVRNLTGGNTMAAHGKHEKSENFDPDFLLRLITNSLPKFNQELKDADERRLAVHFYPCSFRAPHLFKAANANHRKLKEFKQGMMGDFAAELLLWSRLLAPIFGMTGQKTVWPIPSESLQIIRNMIKDSQKQGAAGSAEVAPVDQFVATKLTNLKPGDVPSSRAKITDAYVKFCQEVLLLGGVTDIAAGLELRNRLVWADKPWQRNVKGSEKKKTEKVMVFRFEAGTDFAGICTLA
jgi:hypothetical protein